MKVTQLRLAGQGAWPELNVDQFATELNVFFGHPRTGKSTVAQLASQLLYGKHDSAWRRQFGQSTPLAEGSLEVDGPRGRYLLRRHRDGSPDGRLSIAAVGGPAVDSGTIRSLLSGISPRLVSELYAVDFAQPPRPAALLDGDFAREFTLALAPEAAANGTVCQTHAEASPAAFDRNRIDALVRRRDEIVRQIEEEMAARRRESGALQQELQTVEAALAERRRRADDAHTKLRSADAKLAEIETRLRYFNLESSVRRGPEIDVEKQRLDLEQLDAQIGRCRQTLSDLQSREATVRRELAEVHPDGTADSAGSLADQRATVGVFERLLDDLDAEVSQLARSHEPGRCVGCDSHARISPVAQMLRQQLYALCGQVTEQERTVRRMQLQAETRQLARAQTDLSEQLEHLLQRRQELIHSAQLTYRPVVLLPQSPAASHCHCHGHAEFVRSSDAMLLSRNNRGQHEASARATRAELEQQRNELRAACDSLQQEIKALEARWQTLQRDRAQTATRSTLDELRAELAQLEIDIARVVEGAATPTLAQELHAAPHRGPWKASDALAQLTDGRLVQIRTNRDGHGATVIDREGRVLPLNELSAAQQDQLYLALTLALTSSLSARGIDLPLFLDEPFLRQEPRDAAAMAGVLHEFARQGRQVIVFTEDREAVRRFESLGVEVRDLDVLRRAKRPATAPVPPVVVETVQPEPAAGTVKIVRETVGERKPQLRIAGEWTQDEDEQDVFFLNRTASIADFPVLGNDTAKIFAEFKILTVEDLLVADAVDVAAKLGRLSIPAEAIRLWQSHMSLMCFVPGVSLNDAQVLAANDMHTPEALFTVDVRLLAESIDRFLATERGRRFASLRSRYTRDQLAEVQKLARTQRDVWQQAKVRYSWIDAPIAEAPQPPARPAVVTARSEKQKGAPPAKGNNRNSPGKATKTNAPLRFFLGRSSQVVDAPSIGPIAAKRLAKVGIRTVADLLNCSPESTAEELAESKLTPAVITRWQQEARLVCRIPELRGVGAQLLVASGFTEAEQVARAKAEELVKRVRATCRSPQGERILRDGAAPSAERIAQWVQHAAQMRPLEAA